ncbi:type II toxin-antitoxin system RelE/ParE family toxin [Promicromonospora sp. NPDC090134]|uniref:type II toxin-antitoxin system RelE/ParE family toxin n=1 Tax=Promicromonospora sp. NPDC090134 TaxID=3364408 RepID=UPI00382FAF6A
MRALTGADSLSLERESRIFLRGELALAWEILITDGVEEFLDELYASDRESHQLVNEAIQVLEDNGPMEGRPLVDSIVGSTISNLKELRPPSRGRTEVRVLFCFDPWRSAILLVAGDKSGRWRRWHLEAIPAAERIYATYLDEREGEVADGRC